jgi:hypothetical protein
MTSKEKDAEVVGTRTCVGCNAVFDLTRRMAREFPPQKYCSRRCPALVRRRRASFKSRKGGS